MSHVQGEFAALLEKSSVGYLPQEGDIVTGHVVQIIPDSIVVDFGHKSEGLVPRSEFIDASGEIEIKEGDSVEVYLEQLETDDGFAILSKEKAEVLKVWDHLEEAITKDLAVDGTVVGKIKGGLSVDIGVKAFLPASQIDVRSITSIDRFIGRKFKFKILKLNKRKGNVIVSRRVLLEKDRDQVRLETLQNVKVGMRFDGTVKNITDYGAFIDLGGVDGLLHIKDMSWGRLAHPSEICQVGDKVGVVVLGVEEKTGKVSLGTKQLTPDPWDGIERRLSIGSKVKAKVVNVMDYGAFLELERGVEGLAHVSEMTWTKKAKPPSKLATTGSEVDVVILDIDRENRRISLGMKQLMENPWESLRKKYSEGTVVTGTVRNVTDFGVFVGFEDLEIDGLIHVSDVSWTRKVRHPQDFFKKGDVVKAVVLVIDVASERFSLGIKQMYEDPWPRIRGEYHIGQKMKGGVIGVGGRGIDVEVEPGVEGVIPKSAISNDGTTQLKKSYERGQQVDVALCSIDEAERRIVFSLIES